MKSKVRGFTLIELLIVVAIIAILAAIAVPNFLEAQTRAKVSRTKNDLRAYATALEAYAVDHNCYPGNNQVAGASFDGPLLKLSTPVAYLTNGWLEDPFGNSEFLGEGGQAHYFYGSYTQCDAVISLLLAGNLSPRLPEAHDLRYSVVGAGPDRIYTYQLCIENGGTVIGCLDVIIEEVLEGGSIYDPTNGTISFGDIRRTTKGQQTGPYAVPD